MKSLLPLTLGSTGDGGSRLLRTCNI